MELFNSTGTIVPAGMTVRASAGVAVMANATINTLQSFKIAPPMRVLPQSGTYAEIFALLGADSQLAQRRRGDSLSPKTLWTPKH